jgi:hypothetical protein
MSEIKVLRPDTQPTDVVGLVPAQRGPLAGTRLIVIDNGKPRAGELLVGIGRHLVDEYGVASVVKFAKGGASRPITAEQVEELAGSGDIFLTGLGDCGGCSACSLQDALLMERAGKPATAVISEPFQGRIASYSAKLGAPGYAVTVVPHPVSSRSEEYLAGLAARMAETVAGQLGSG